VVKLKISKPKLLNMKKTLINFTFMLLLISCNNEATTENGDKDSAEKNDTTARQVATACKPDPNYKNWELPKGLGLAMRRATNKCGDFGITEANWEIQKEIDAAYPYDKFDRGWYNARHLSNRPEYASLRCIPQDSPKAKVDQYCTQLYMVWPKLTVTSTTRVADTTYYDIISICPPPRGEDCLSFQEYINSKAYSDSVRAYSSNTKQ
jgi:hypothetical protein